MNPLLINLNGWEIPIIVLVILILFGERKYLNSCAGGK